MKKAITILFLATIVLSCSKPKNSELLQGKVENEQIAVVSKIPGKIIKILGKRR